MDEQKIIDGQFRVVEPSPKRSRLDVEGLTQMTAQAIAGLAFVVVAKLAFLPLTHLLRRIVEGY